MKSKNHTCNLAKGTKCVSCQRKSLKSNMNDFTLCEDHLDLITGGMNPDDLQKAMESATTDMELEMLTPTTYFE